MKIFLFVLFMCLLSALVLARDLSQVAKAERQRRRTLAVARGDEPSPMFTNRDLQLYRERRSSMPTTSQEPSRPASSRSDLSKERAHWQKEKEKHRRELAQIDARIRRLKWRLAERKGRRRPGEGLREDPAETALEQTLESLEEERARRINDFLERGRRAGALPGWLR